MKVNTKLESGVKLEYTVQYGDTLTNIAKKYYGDANQWRNLYLKNIWVIGLNPNIIQPGQKLEI